MKKIAIVQSNYIPWKGYFDMISAVDEFYFYDDVQFTKNDWRNRNLIKTPSGTQWLSVPVGQNINRKINEVEIYDARWQIKHWKTLQANYSRASFFDEISDWLKPIYLYEQFTHISKLNRRLIEAICYYLEIKTILKDSSEFNINGSKTERLVNLCQQVNAEIYVSGPAASSYLVIEEFQKAQIQLVWFNYSKYKPYPQLWGEFDHKVSILDLLFNCGKESFNFMNFVK